MIKPLLAAGEDSLVHVSRDALPGDAFALSMSKVWEVIKSQKDLNLPAHKVSRRAGCCDGSVPTAYAVAAVHWLYCALWALAVCWRCHVMAVTLQLDLSN